LFGSLDASGVGLLAATVLRHVRDGDVVLDLADLTSVDEGGIGGFVEFARALPPDSKLTLLSPRPSVARVLERSGVLESVPNMVLFFTHDPSAAGGRGSSWPGTVAQASVKRPMVVSLDERRERPASLARMTAPDESAAPRGSADLHPPDVPERDRHQPFIFLG
jgi:anti-anti-sigma regulatory factor